jgi:hypothetical protein
MAGSWMPTKGTVTWTAKEESGGDEFGFEWSDKAPHSGGGIIVEQTSGGYQVTLVSTNGARYQAESTTMQGSLLAVTVVDGTTDFFLSQTGPNTLVLRQVDDNGRPANVLFDLRPTTFKAPLGATASRAPGTPSPSPIRNAQQNADVIASTIAGYLKAMDTKDHVSMRRQLTPNLRRQTSIDHLKATYATSRVADIVVRHIAFIDTQTATAFVAFTSTQAAAYGPNGDTRDRWTLDYALKSVSGHWLIDRISAHKGSTHTSA